LQAFAPMQWPVLLACSAAQAAIGAAANSTAAAAAIVRPVGS